MGNLFRPDGRAASFLDRASNLVLLNLVWLLCCLPVVTAGASTTALYYVTLRWNSQGSETPLRSFFRAFRQNFRQAAGMTLLLLAAAGLLAADFWILTGRLAGAGRVGIYLVSVAAAAVVLTAVYCFPLLAFFDDKTGTLLRNALLMSVRHLPETAVILLTSAAPLLLAGALLRVTHAVLYAWVVAGGALTALVNSHFFRRVFSRYGPDMGDRARDDR